MDKSDWNERDHPRDENNQKFVKKGVLENSDNDNIHLTKNDYRDTLKKPSVVILPKKEYAELCSAVSTRYANRIPKNGKIVYGNFVYNFIYNKREMVIEYIAKTQIPNSDYLRKDLVGGYYDDEY